ncbi:MAG TPA: hypothetical protein VF690_12685 [Hymenobacter sp.]
MAPFVSVILFVTAFYMFVGRFKTAETGIVPLERLPANNEIVCYRSLTLDGSDGVIISLDSTNHYSFSLPASERKLQTKIIKQVGLLHRIRFTGTQLISLNQLPYVPVNVQALPALLSLPAAKRLGAAQRGASSHLDSTQLAEYLRLGKEMAGRSTYYGRLPIYLKIDSSAKIPQVEQLISLLGAQGINRFNLLTQSNHH